MMKTAALDTSANFLLDDLPVIRDNLRKGFLETQSTVNKWVQNFKKKLDGEEDEDDFDARPARPAQGRYGQPGGGSMYGRRSGDTGRRSGDRERYDADPQVLGDDFATLQMRDDEGQYLECLGYPITNVSFSSSTTASPTASESRPLQAYPFTPCRSQSLISGRTR